MFHNQIHVPNSRSRQKDSVDASSESTAEEVRTVDGNCGIEEAVEATEAEAVAVETKEADEAEAVADGLSGPLAETGNSGIAAAVALAGAAGGGGGASGLASTPGGPIISYPSSAIIIDTF
ncbi:hypothetical protein GCK72_013355 [Caenorhabditis remanei]|uniref:Uncharacterized protein n=1 Tax=Caenorhabditis remanei TaxID=31234 RepID=A0A6A5GQF1_CAERE|nr:hypothetical protein GCK72_013355 [Caenorhabditis remanei]KAF1756901.1 hypothetical protein GCK72_013355 [Caenorhabditis remanei]